MASLLPTILLILVFPNCLSSTDVHSSRKELRTKNEVNKQPIIQLGHSTQSTRLDPSQVIQLSWQPRAFLYRGFLSDEECEHLISLAHGKLEKSSMIGLDSEKNMDNNEFTTSVAPLFIEKDDVIARIEDRISAWTFLPNENSEHVQIIRYLPEEETKQHTDYFGAGSGEPVMATVVLYLSNVTKGGETLFPESEFKNSQPKDDTWSDCAKNGFAVKPIKGNALLFFSLNLNAAPDANSRSTGCPILEGESWFATKLYYVKAAIPKKNLLFESDRIDCTDEEDNCAEWAANGECQRNPVYMIGTADYYGSCRRSCEDWRWYTAYVIPVISRW